LQRAFINDVLETGFVSASVVSVIWEEKFTIHHFTVVMALFEGAR